MHMYIYMYADAFENTIYIYAYNVCINLYTYVYIYICLFSLSLYIYIYICNRIPTTIEISLFAQLSESNKPICAARSHIDINHVVFKSCSMLCSALLCCCPMRLIVNT